ncbi:retrovirus-related pol polyprotein from transposon TNT 1-94 [Tanacetum coccineum]
MLPSMNLPKAPRSALVKDPEPPSVSPTKKQVDDLFQWFDDDEVVSIPPVVPITPVHVPAAPAPENCQCTALEHSCGIEAMQEEIHEFERFRCMQKVRTWSSSSGREKPPSSTAKTGMEVSMLVKPEGFVDPEHPSYVYHLKKALYGLKQAPRAWYDKLSAFLIKSGFTKGVVDPTLFTRKAGKHILLAQLLKMHLTAIKRIFRYLKGTIHMGLWYPKDSGFELKAFADADYAGCHDTRRSTSGSAQFLGHRLVSWSSKKQKSTAISTTEAEYIALSGVVPVLGCALKLTRLWICVPTKFRCIVTIKVERKVVELYFVETKYQLADIFTKALPRERFATLLPLLGVKQMSPETLKELLDESVSESKGRTVADSIAERLTRPTAYKFKTDCSIHFLLGILKVSVSIGSLVICAISPHLIL